MSRCKSTTALVGPVPANSDPYPLGRHALLAYSEIMAILSDLEPSDRRRVVDAVGSLVTWSPALLRGKGS